MDRKPKEDCPTCRGNEDWVQCNDCCKWFCDYCRLLFQGRGEPTLCDDCYWPVRRGRELEAWASTQTVASQADMETWRELYERSRWFKRVIDNTAEDLYSPGFYRDGEFEIIVDLVVGSGMLRTPQSTP